MNPRRPTPAGPQPAPSISSTYGSAHGFPSQGVSHEAALAETLPSEQELQGFYEWCIGRGASAKTCEQYVRYLQRPFNPDNKWSRLAWKAYYKYIGRDDLWKSIKVKRSGVDLYVPSDEDVFAALRLACTASEEMCWAYKLLVYSGLRLTEVAKLLREAEPSKWIAVGDFYKYPLAWRRGFKQAFYAYSLEKPPRLGIEADDVSDWASGSKAVAPKYIRKWVATKMLSLGVPEETVNFIQGRVPQEILAKHYLKLATLADQYYRKYAEWLRDKLASIV